MIKGIIFDYGGTIDTDSIHWAEVIWRGYQHFGADIEYDHYRMAYVHGERTLAKFPVIKENDNFLQLLIKKLDIQTSFLVDAHLWHTMEKHEQTRKEVSDNIAHFCYSFVVENLKKSRPVLAELAEKFPLVLVSNFYGNIHAILEDFKLQYFKEVIESAVVGVRKPNPDIFRLGVDALGLKPQEVIVVGDSFDKDIIPANAIGCKTVWIKGIEWDKDNVHDETIPSRIITTIANLKEAVDSISQSKCN